MAETYVFTTYKLNRFYQQQHVLKDISLSFYHGAKIGIVGENGAGKSTLLKIMAGLDQDFDGQARLEPGYSSAIVMQEPELDPDLTVRQTLESAFAATQALLTEFEEVSTRMGEPLDDDEMQKVMDRMAVLQDELDSRDAWALDQRLEEAADALCLPEDERLVGSLSGGEKRRVALARALLARPDILLLDEPTNHLDAPTVDWLEDQLRAYPGTVLVVTHDRYFLDTITAWILELDHGHGIPWQGSYAVWIEQKLKQLVDREGKTSDRRKAMERELAFIRMSGDRRHELSQQRLREYESMIAHEASRQEGDAASIQIAPGPALGTSVIAFEGVTKGYEGSALFENLSFALPRGAVVGLVGPNGAGKTTLFRLITGQEQPDTGTVVLGDSVSLAYVDQDRSGLADEQPLVDAVADGADELVFGRRRVPVRQYLSWFGFRGPTQQKKVGELSGGERNRFHLARTLRVGGNVILLDEPTNDLDVNTLRMLEEAILEFAGCVLVISHDRFFLDRVCTHLLVFEGEGTVAFHAGNWSEYEAARRKKLGSGLYEGRRKRFHRLH
ncbi:MAG: energy-dependent translational throttle protein EttA [Deltaproteobacteria bacterium RIFOXYA12_FULL_61_11]|nr:MAG: energy-dependent translational throttle protein EttA [Deltaproteobacteria bacterium RIFOXYA12_FULL_61_11]